MASRGIDLKIKNVILMFTIIHLSGCLTPSPDQMERASEYDERAKAARERAAAHGELPGTPENMKGIRKAEGQAVSFQNSADKADDTWLDHLVSIFF